MNTVELNALCEKIRTMLAELGMSRESIWSYSGGLRAIGRYFDEQNSAYSTDGVNEYIKTVRKNYENGNISHVRFCNLRKCVSFIEDMRRDGSINLARMAEWKYSNNPLRVSATPEQYDSTDNLYGLVCKVREALNKLGYAKGSIEAYNCHGFDRILRHCSAMGVSYYDKTLIDKFVVSIYEQDLKDNAHKVKLYLPRKAADLLEKYHDTGEIKLSRLTPLSTANPNPGMMELVEKYLVFGRDDMNYSSGSLINRRNVIRRYLLAAENLKHYDLTKMTVSDAKRSIMEYLQPGSGKTHMIYPIREFLKFLYENEITSEDLSIVVPRKYSPKHHIKEGYSMFEIDALLNSINRETKSGKRDYAAILLAQATGLRGSDVINLKLSEVDWKLWEINVVQQKTGNPIKIALTASVGNAIADYILNGRPQSTSPYIFLRHRTPYERLTAPNCLIKRHLPLTTIDGQTVPSKGFHGLRRAFGVELLRAGTPFYIISEMLGTVNPDAVKPYLALHDQELKNCALSPMTGAKEVGL